MSRRMNHRMNHRMNNSLGRLAIPAVAAVALLLGGVAAHAQGSPLGLWKTIDESPKSPQRDVRATRAMLAIAESDIDDVRCVLYEWSRADEVPANIDNAQTIPNSMHRDPQAKMARLYKPFSVHEVYGTSHNTLKLRSG